MTLLIYLSPFSKAQLIHLFNCERDPKQKGILLLTSPKMKYPISADAVTSIFSIIFVMLVSSQAFLTLSDPLFIHSNQCVIFSLPLTGCPKACCQQKDRFLIFQPHPQTPISL